MATKTWTLLRGAILKMNKQRYLSVMQGRNNLTASINSRTLSQNAKVTDTGFQKMEMNNPGEDLHRTEFINAGIMSMADLPSAHSLRSKDQFSAPAQSGLECRRCLTHLAHWTTHEKTHNDSKDDEKTKESLCGLLFNSYVLCLFVLGSYVPID